MQRIARFGNVWKHRKTGKIHGTSIDVKSFEELQEYEQIPRQQAKNFKPKEKELSKEAEGESLFDPAKSRRS